MLTTKAIHNKKTAATVTVNLPVKNSLQSIMQQLKKRVISLHPLHWFDGLMDGIEIELNEFQPAKRNKPKPVSHDNLKRQSAGV